MTEHSERHQAMVKAARFCAYRERSTKEVRDKLLSEGLDPDLAENILDDLIAEGFIDEDRFLESYIKGKFNSNKWGKIKIRYALLHHDIPEKIIIKSLDSLIPEGSYLVQAGELMTRKLREVEGQPPLKIKQKVFQFLTGKGYEMEVIRQLWDDTEYNV